MSNISPSECSSGCESGWTTYWDQLSTYSTDFVRNHNEKGSAHFVQEDDEDDLSMVSDASSRPSPHLHENSVSPDKKTSKQKNKTKEAKKQQHQFCQQLDDTATSPVLHFYQNNVASPPENQYNSVDHRETMPKKHLGFFKSSKKGKSGSKLGKKRQ